MIWIGLELLGLFLVALGVIYGDCCSAMAGVAIIILVEKS